MRSPGHEAAVRPQRLALEPAHQAPLQPQSPAGHVPQRCAQARRGAARDDARDPHRPEGTAESTASSSTWTPRSSDRSASGSSAACTRRSAGSRRSNRARSRAADATRYPGQPEEPGMAGEPYVVITADSHAGASIETLSRLSRREAQVALRRVARRLPQSAAHAHRQQEAQELGRRRAHAGTWRARGRGRDDLPEHGPTVLPHAAC